MRFVNRITDVINTLWNDHRRCAGMAQAKKGMVDVYLFGLFPL